MTTPITKSTQSTAKSSSATVDLPTSAAVVSTAAKTHGLMVETDHSNKPSPQKPPPHSSKKTQSLPVTPNKNQTESSYAEFSKLDIPWMKLGMQALDSHHISHAKSTSSSASHKSKAKRASDSPSASRFPSSSPPSQSPTYVYPYAMPMSALWTFSQAQRQNSPRNSSSGSSSASTSSSTSGNTTPRARLENDVEPSSIAKKVGRSSSASPSSSPRIAPLAPTASMPGLDLNPAHSVFSSTPLTSKEAYHARKAEEYRRLAALHAEELQKLSSAREASSTAAASATTTTTAQSAPAKVADPATATTTAQSATAKATDPATPPAATDSGNTATSTESLFGKAARIFKTTAVTPVTSAEKKFGFTNL